MDRTRAYQFIDAAEIVTNLSTTVNVPLPLNEGQARPLRVLPAEQQCEAGKQAVETAPMAM